MIVLLDQIALLKFFFWIHANLIKHGSKFPPRE